MMQLMRAVASGFSSSVVSHPVRCPVILFPWFMRLSVRASDGGVSTVVPFTVGMHDCGACTRITVPTSIDTHEMRLARRRYNAVQCTCQRRRRLSIWYHAGVILQQRFPVPRGPTPLVVGTPGPARTSGSFTMSWVPLPPSLEPQRQGARARGLHS